MSGLIVIDDAFLRWIGIQPLLLLLVTTPIRQERTEELLRSIFHGRPCSLGGSRHGVLCRDTQGSPLVRRGSSSFIVVQSLACTTRKCFTSTPLSFYLNACVPRIRVRVHTYIHVPGIGIQCGCRCGSGILMIHSIGQIEVHMSSDPSRTIILAKPLSWTMTSCGKID